MDNNKIEYLKRAIKRSYKRYTGERTDGKATLLDVAKFFNIPVDESRLDDYIIKKIDYNTPSIEIKDEKNDITYNATYIGNADLLNDSGAMQFNKVISASPIRKEEVLYYIGNETPIINKMTFSDGEYELVFEREIGNYIGFGLDAESKFVIRYIKNVNKEDRQGKQKLLSKIFMNKYNNETFEQTYTYSTQHLIDYDDNQDKYCYTQNGNIVYGVNNCDIKDLIHYLHGICFESMNTNVGNYLPFNIKIEDFPELTNVIYKSGIVFRGGTDNGIHHIFTIFKTKNPSNIIEAAAIDCGIYLKYEAIRWENFRKENGMPDHRKVIVAHKEARYPRMDNGDITSTEIRNITDILDTEFEDDTFIQIVINELKTFANKMDIQKGIVEGEFDPLSPKLFVDKSFDEICALVSANKNDYFNLISEQFASATNIKKETAPTLIKTFKQDDEHMRRLSQIIRKDFEEDE